MPVATFQQNLPSTTKWPEDTSQPLSPPPKKKPNLTTAAQSVLMWW